jgi:hypothetical protein
MMLAQTIAMSSRQFIYAFDEKTMHVLIYCDCSDGGVSPAWCNPVRWIVN